MIKAKYNFINMNAFCKTTFSMLNYIDVFLLMVLLQMLLNKVKKKLELVKTMTIVTITNFEGYMC